MFACGWLIYNCCDLGCGIVAMCSVCVGFVVVLVYWLFGLLIVLLCRLLFCYYVVGCFTCSLDVAVVWLVMLFMIAVWAYLVWVWLISIVF